MSRLGYAGRRLLQAVPIILAMAIFNFLAGGWLDDVLLALRHRDFVQACVARGMPVPAIVFRQILPNAAAPVIVTGSRSSSPCSRSTSSAKASTTP